MTKKKKRLVRYFGMGHFSKATEIAGRLSDALPSEGNSSAFKEFAISTDKFSVEVVKLVISKGKVKVKLNLFNFMLEPLRVDSINIYLYKPKLKTIYNLFLSTKGSLNWGYQILKKHSMSSVCVQKKETMFVGIPDYDGEGKYKIEVITPVGTVLVICAMKGDKIFFPSDYKFIGA